jgi:hypothetical protein
MANPITTASSAKAQKRAEMTWSRIGGGCDSAQGIHMPVSSPATWRDVPSEST